MRMDTGRILATLRDRDLVPDQCQAAFLVGSTARGWSNKKSDLDICVVSAEPWSFPDSVEVAVSLEPDVVHWHTFHADNRDWDLAYWVDAQVDQMLTKISWAEYDQVRATSNDVLPPREESFLGRIATCVPLIGEDWVARRRAELDASAFRSVLVTRSLGAADRAIEDGLGQLADGDLHSAVISARLAYGHTVDALLEERESTGVTTSSGGPAGSRPPSPRRSPSTSTGPSKRCGTSIPTIRRNGSTRSSPHARTWH